MQRSTKIIAAIVFSVSVITGATASGTYKDNSAEARTDFMVRYVSHELSLDSTQETHLRRLSKKISVVRQTLIAKRA